jgi:hypothetical protein
MPYYAVGTDGKDSSHVMFSVSSNVPGPIGPAGILASALWSGGSRKFTLCGLPALHSFSTLNPSDVSCEHCKMMMAVGVAAGVREPPANGWAGVLCIFLVVAIFLVIYLSVNG